MHAFDNTNSVTSSNEGLTELPRSYTLEPTGSGYGVSAYLAPDLITCRLYNLSINELIAMRRFPGEYANLPGTELKDVATNILDEISIETGIPLSKFNVAVVSGTTALESKFAGFYSDNQPTATPSCLAEFGCDIEYMLAGTNSIAVGEAFLVPCLSDQMGGDFLCSMLAIDIMCAEKPILLINTQPQALKNGMSITLALGNKDNITVCAVPAGTDVNQAISRFLEICEAEHNAIERTILAGNGDVALPDSLRARARKVSEAAIEGASAILMSESAEDELCRIVSSCNIINL